MVMRSNTIEIKIWFSPSRIIELHQKIRNQFSSSKQWCYLAKSVQLYFIKRNPSAVLIII